MLPGGIANVSLLSPKTKQKTAPSSLIGGSQGSGLYPYLNRISIPEKYPLQDPYADLVVLFLEGEGANGSTSIVDSSPNPVSITRSGSINISTAQYVYGGSSIYVGSTSSYLVPPNSTFAFGTADFTIEMWLNLNTPASTTWPYVIGSSTYNSGTGFYLLVVGAGTGWGGAGVLSFNGASTLEFRPGVSGTTELRGTGWHHIAITRVGVTTRLFCDGNLEGQHVADGIANYGVSNPRIFAPAGSTGSNIGYFDNIRVTHGAARYTKNFDPLNYFATYM